MSDVLTVLAAQSNALYMLGKYKFMLTNSVPQTVSRSTEYRWPSQQRFGQRPTSQFVGIGEDSMTFSGVIFPEFRGGLHEVDKFRAMAGTGQPHLLVSGHGAIMGYWLIEKVEEEQSVFAMAGAFRKQTFSLTIRRHHGEDVSAGSVLKSAIKAIIS